MRTFFYLQPDGSYSLVDTDEQKVYSIEFPEGSPPPASALIIEGQARSVEPVYPDDQTGAGIANWWVKRLGGRR